MNPDTRLPEDARRLLGEQAAAELERDERWLAGRLDAVRVPDAVRDRLMQSIAGELARPRRTAWQRYGQLIRIAAVLAFALLVALFARLISPTHPGGRGDDKIAIAQDAVNHYLAAVPPSDLQLHDTLARLDRAAAAPQGQDNPFQSIAAVIESPGGRR